MDISNAAILCRATGLEIVSIGPQMRVNSKGQVTIPIEIRDRLGIQPNTEVRFVVRHGRVVLEKEASRGSMNRPARGEVIVNRLREIARQSEKATMTTDELMALTRDE